MTTEMITRRHLPHWFVPEAFHFVTYRLAGTIPRQVIGSMQRKKEEALKEKRPAGLAPAAFRERIHKQFFAAYDRYLDNNRDIQWLAEPRVAAVIRENLYHHRGTKYELLSYCIMPNHVHVLLRPIGEEPVDGAVGQAALPVLGEDGQARLPVLREEDGQARLPVLGEYGQAALPVLGEDGQARLPVLREGEVPDSLGSLAGIMHSLKSYTASRANKILGRSGPFWQDESYDHWVRDADELERIVQYIAANPVKAGLVGEAHECLFCSAHDRFLQDGSREAWLLS